MLRVLVLLAVEGDPPLLLRRVARDARLQEENASLNAKVSQAS